MVAPRPIRAQKKPGTGSATGHGQLRKSPLDYLRPGLASLCPRSQSLWATAGTVQASKKEAAHRRRFEKHGEPVTAGQLSSAGPARRLLPDSPLDERGCMRLRLSSNLTSKGRYTICQAKSGPFRNYFRLKEHVARGTATTAAIRGEHVPIGASDVVPGRET